ncbi:MAG: 4-hydroxythreonine-4-phosphate dehydrogenase PdxA [Bacteroidetes bacterium]|nr:4-hydroxythreonine-4-phosphate dehydrogenase PdxA [Bacteroidota bacterium]
MKPRIGITIGDFNGIGPEVVLKSITAPKIRKAVQPVLIGSYALFSYYAKLLKIDITLTEVSSPRDAVKAGEVPVITVHPATVKSLQVGKNSPDAGVCAGMAVEQAIKFCLDGSIDAMVTAPVSKEALHFAGYNFPGQTEMLAMLTRSERVTMMLLSSTMRVALATVHIPIKKVSESLFTDRIVEKLETVHASLSKDLGIKNPSIAVLGLNPHAGENGAIGTEEREVIIPAIKKAVEKNIRAFGPFPADGFFASKAYEQYDAILAMYHDQGLIPLKMSGFDEGVNYSAGLRIIRTSPDHGTAFDIAGKNIASPGSTIAAIELAASIIAERKR